MQTDTQEALEYVGDFVQIKYIFAFFVLIFFISLFLAYILKQNDTQKNRQDLVKIFLLLFTCVIFAKQIYHQNSFTEFKQISKWVDNYFKEIKEWQKIRDKRKVGDIKAVTTKKGQLHVVVIGESLARYNLSAYDYPIDTTPFIKSSDNIKLTQVFSNHTHTVPVLSLSLTQANQYNKKTYYKTPSIIQVAQAAKYKVSWLSTQVRVGAYDNMISVLAQDADYKKFLNSGKIGKNSNVKHKDKALLPHIKKYLSNLDEDENNIIFIHTMGSHVNYCYRVKNEKINLTGYKTGIFNNRQNLCYDKSVKYTDEFLQEVYNLAKDKKSFVSMIFMADHADDVFNRLGHSASRFTEYMAQVPFVIWHSDKFDKQKISNLKINKDKIFTNDLLFDTLLGFWDINTTLKNPNYDLTSKNYHLENPLTLHRSRKILELPWQISKKNVVKNPNFMAHRANTIASMLDAKKQGFKNIEIDIFYDDKKHKIIVGNSYKERTDIALQEYLEYEKGYFKRVWLDFKNVNDNNIAMILDRLNKLNEKFNLKNRVLLESGYMGEKFSIFSNHGWSTSYYIPIDKFKKVSNVNQYVRQLLKQLKKQKVASISFDYRVYEYILKYLESNEKFKALNLEFNTWLSLNSADKNFDNKLSKMDVVKSPKVHSIIIQYPTRFRK